MTNHNKPPYRASKLYDSSVRLLRFQHIITIALMLFCLLPAMSSQAQNDRLTARVAVEGRIINPDEEQTWVFNAFEGQMVSLIVESASSGFDPVITLRNNTGIDLLQNDDYNYPTTTNALLQGITLPRTGQYTVVITGFNGTTGDYRLTLYDGYAEFAELAAFDNTENWESDDDLILLTNEEGPVQLRQEGIQREGVAVQDDAIEYADFYAQADFTILSGRNGWIVGLVLRQSGDNFYVLMLNQLGQWRIEYRTNDEERVVRDWTTHPAIRAGEANFTLGVLANGAGFDVFYNGASVGQAVDETFSAESGTLGFYVRTPNAIGSAVDFTAENLFVSLPIQINGQEIVPSQLMPGSPGLTIQELERRRVIPVGGVQTLTVPESSGRRIDVGVNRIPLGRGETYEDYVIGTTFTAQAESDGETGCGLLFANLSETEHSLAFLDQTGAYGLSTRTDDAYTPGIFGVSDNPDWQTGRQELLVVHNGETAYFYINNQHVGTTELPTVRGEVGNVVINYAPINTFCEFSNTWLWSLDD